MENSICDKISALADQSKLFCVTPYLLFSTSLNSTRHGRVRLGLGRERGLEGQGEGKERWGTKRPKLRSRLGWQTGFWSQVPGCQYSNEISQHWCFNLLTFVFFSKKTEGRGVNRETGKREGEREREREREREGEEGGREGEREREREREGGGGGGGGRLARSEAGKYKAVKGSHDRII